jgi:hypothetical protein
MRWKPALNAFAGTFADRKAGGRGRLSINMETGPPDPDRPSTPDEPLAACLVMRGGRWFRSGT